MNCIICDYKGEAISRITLGAIPCGRTTGEFVFFRCPKCGSDILTPLPDDSAEDIYEDEYMFRMPSEASVLDRIMRKIEWEMFYAPIYKSDAAWLKRYTTPGRNRLLDVGFGTGLRLKVFMESGFDAHGIETSAKCVEYADKVLGCDVRRARIEDVPESEKYDIITAYAVLEHIKDPRRFIQNLKTHLAPGGLLLFRVPVNDSLQLGIFKQKHSLYREAPRHVWIPSIKAMTEYPENFGLSFLSKRSEPILSAAGHIGLTLVPQGTYAQFLSKGVFKNIYRILAALFMLVPGIPIAVFDALRGVGAQTDFLYKNKQ
ncbi:MAG TPA: class I SAM-dependent methyltransferase [Candidatus Omnitrophota bacterium]|nr:class I SAM-dependent methyltransferase [Candidatus Omnitrophota bacterium]HPS20923.1 class I SAM-dependent methyltransferase [Candidatus Omnitrophota bacterium]